jgi:Virulence factor BrkB
MDWNRIEGNWKQLKGKIKEQWAMFGKAWELGKESVASFINDGALSRGAAIAFYAVTSIGPVLLIVVAIAGLAFGQDAARGAIVSQLSGLMGQESAELLQNVIRSAAGKSSGVFASAVGVITSSALQFAPARESFARQTRGGGVFDVAAEFETHHRQKPIAECVLLARAKEPISRRNARSIKRSLKNRIAVFIALPIRSLEKLSLANRLKEIGRMEGASRGGKSRLMRNQS